LTEILQPRTWLGSSVISFYRRLKPIIMNSSLLPLQFYAP